MAEESIPMSKGTGKRKKAIWGDDEYGKVVKDREKARRKCRNSYDPQHYIDFKKSRTVATKVIKVAIHRSWRTFCGSLSDRSKIGSVWKVINRLNNVGKNDAIPSLKIGDSYSKDHKEKANSFATHFDKVSSSANYPAKFRSHKELLEREHEEVFRHRINTDSILNTDFRLA